MFQIRYKEKLIISISDTHGKHRDLVIPDCDVLIHCGDICNFGNTDEILDFFLWFSQTKAKYKLFLSGNHDFPFVFEPNEALQLIPNNVIFIEDRIKIIVGITFYGLNSAIDFFEMPKIANREIDFLITHIPPKLILDEKIGCPILRKFVKIQKPKFHLFGHAHRCANKKRTINSTVFVNCCSIF